MSSYQKLTPEIISRLNNLSLKARFVVEGFIVGLHKSPYHGISAEFSEHRTYGVGDEIRHLDWKLWAKTDRFFIKQFEEETNLKSYILMDQSLSMTYKSSKISKLEYSQILAASLGYLMLKQQDAVGLTLFDNKIRLQIPPSSKRSQLSAIFSYMENIRAESNTNLGPMLHRTAEIIKKRGLIILISDLFDKPSELLSGLQHFRYNGHEVIVFHILDQNELNLDFSKRTRFIDLESDQEIITDPWYIQLEYKKKITAFCEEIKQYCMQKKIDYVQLTTDTELGVPLSEYLIKRKRLN